MGLYRRGKIYWFNIQYQGRRIQESLNTDNKRLAEKIYAKVLTEIVEGRYFDAVKAKKLTFRELVEKYMQKYQKSRDHCTVKQLLPVFGDMFLAAITTEKVSDYREERLKRVKPATVYMELALMRRMFNVAIKEWEWLRDNPVSRLSFAVGNQNARDRWLTDEEEQGLLACTASHSWLKNLTVFALHTGMRRGEILNLKWQDVDFKRRIVTVVKSKNGEKRAIPMTGTLHDVLKSMTVRHISGRVFPVSKGSLYYAFNCATSKAGVKNFRFHDLRHTFATRLVQRSIDLYRVKELLGHKSIAMTMRYAHHCPESLRDSVKVLDKCYNSATVGECSV